MAAEESPTKALDDASPSSAWNLSSDVKENLGDELIKLWDHHTQYQIDRGLEIIKKYTTDHEKGYVAGMPILKYVNYNYKAHSLHQAIEMEQRIFSVYAAHVREEGEIDLQLLYD